jgi:hypothetical protein
VARRPATDERQADIFGTTLPAQPEPPTPPARQSEGKQAKSRAPAPQDHQDAPAAPGIDALAARLSAAELDEFAAVLSNESLAHLALAVVRQLRRRLARAGGKSRSSGKGRAAILERAARQLATELGGLGGGGA